MMATPVERLGNVSLPISNHHQIPRASPPGTFDQVNRNSIRCQLGF
jgi:hypothetical protein